MEVQCSWTPEESIRPQEARVHRLLWTTMWVLECKPRSFARAASAQNCWAIAPAPPSLMLYSCLHCNFDQPSNYPVNKLILWPVCYHDYNTEATELMGWWSLELQIGGRSWRDVHSPPRADRALLSAEAVVCFTPGLSKSQGEIMAPSWIGSPGGSRHQVGCNRADSITSYTWCPTILRAELLGNWAPSPA